MSIVRIENLTPVAISALEQLRRAVQGENYDGGNIDALAGIVKRSDPAFAKALYRMAMKKRVSNQKRSELMGQVSELVEIWRIVPCLRITCRVVR